MEEKLDYLFVDEAGQVSVANLSHVTMRPQSCTDWRPDAAGAANPEAHTPKTPGESIRLLSEG